MLRAADFVFMVSNERKCDSIFFYHITFLPCKTGLTRISLTESQFHFLSQGSVKVMEMPKRTR